MMDKKHTNSTVIGALSTQVGGSHYKTLRIQPIEYIHANGIPFAEGNVIKYVTRWRDKGGIRDLEKAKHFIELLIDLETKRTGPQEQRVADTPLPTRVLGGSDPELAWDEYQRQKANWLNSKLGPGQEAV
jgi:hypothetical protein